MDCMMPIMDGLTATQQIRQWEEEQNRPRVPIVALTASVLPEEIQSCFDAGMDAYLPKPYKSKQLFDIFLSAYTSPSRSLSGSQFTFTPA
ncbi:response regulator [Vibrio sinaloensis]|nr:response regulator [Vibrio sinaloensis]